MSEEQTDLVFPPILPLGEDSETIGPPADEDMETVSDIFQPPRVEELVDTAIRMLVKFQAGSCPCKENNIALKALRDAKFQMERRTADRASRGVRGTDAA